jgi:hypothetical protein
VRCAFPRAAGRLSTQLLRMQLHTSSGGAAVTNTEGSAHNAMRMQLVTGWREGLKTRKSFSAWRGRASKGRLSAVEAPADAAEGAPSPQDADPSQLAQKFNLGSAARAVRTLSNVKRPFR